MWPEVYKSFLDFWMFHVHRHVSWSSSSLCQTESSASTVAGKRCTQVWQTALWWPLTWRWDPTYVNKLEHYGSVKADGRHFLQLSFISTLHLFRQTSRRRCLSATGRELSAVWPRRRRAPGGSCWSAPTTVPSAWETLKVGCCCEHWRVTARRCSAWV